MKITFRQLIDHLIDKGADYIKIQRSTSYCGCVRPNDIIGVEVSRNGKIYFASACHVFDNPTIDVDRIIRDGKGKCLYRETVKQFQLAI